MRLQLRNSPRSRRRKCRPSPLKALYTAVAGESIAAVSSSPFLETLRKKGIEVGQSSVPSLDGNPA